MKFIYSTIIVFFTILISCNFRSTELLQDEIDGVVKRWVPDKRVNICNLTLVKSKGNKMVLKGESTIPEAKTEVLQLLKTQGISVIDSAVIFPDTIQLQKNWGVISLSVANLRTNPNNAAEMASQAIMGTPVRILKVDDGWVLIQTPDHYIAWTNESSIQKMTRAEINQWRNADRMMYIETYGTVYGENTQTTVVSDLVAGAIVIKKTENKGIIEISLPDGRVGFVSNLNWLNFKQWKDTVSLIDNNLLVSAKHFLGFPYLWGGTSSKAMDCSGFTKTVCFLNGVILERDASQQINHGKEIDISSGWNNLQKGDLLFFGSKQTMHPTHVGLYIGDSEFIHCSGSVRINSFDQKRNNFSAHHLSSLIGARRIIGFSPEKGYLPVRLHNWY